MANSFRLPVLIILLIFANLLIWRIDINAGSSNQVVLDDFPRQIGEWLGMDVPNITDNLSERIGPLKVLYRNYRNQDGASVDLLMLTSTLANGGYPHYAEACLSGNGFIIKDRKQVVIKAGEQRITASYIVLERRKKQLVCVYWYASGERFTATHFTSRLIMAKDRVLSPDTRWTFIRLITPIESTPEKAYSDIVSFSSQIIPMIPQI